jgi:hypothetical protein
LFSAKVTVKACEDGYPCVGEDECEYTKLLNKNLKRGNNESRDELLSLICDREKRKICCPNSEEK